MLDIARNQTTKTAASAEELPVNRVNRLAWELAGALNAYHDGLSTAVVLPSHTTEYAVLLSLGRDFQLTQRATYAYRDALLAAENNPSDKEAKKAARVALSWLKDVLLMDRVSMPLQDEDPLLTTIAEYRDGMAAFNARSFPDKEAEAMMEQTFLPPMRTLTDWDTGARTRKGAVEALRIATDEMEQFSGSDVARAMVWAALDYFDAE